MGLLIRLAWLLVRDRSTKLGHPSRRPTQQQRAFTRHNHTPFAPQQRTEGATERFRRTVPPHGPQNTRAINRAHQRAPLTLSPANPLAAGREFPRRNPQPFRFVSSSLLLFLLLFLFPFFSFVLFSTTR